MEKIVVGITCVGSLISQGIIKSIKNCDLVDKIYLIGFEYFPETIGSYWIDETYLMPDILKSKDYCEDYIIALMKNIKTHNI